MQYSIRLDDSHWVPLEPHMEMSKAGIVDKTHPVLLALLYINTGPGHILRAFGWVGGPRTAASPPIDGARVCDWLVTTSIIRLVAREIRGVFLQSRGSRCRLTEKNSFRRTEEGL